MIDRSDLTSALRSHVLRQQARSFSAVGDSAKAIAGLQESVRLDPANPWAHRYLGVVYDRMGHFEEAIASYRMASAIDPYNSTALNVAKDLEHLNRPDDALALERSECQEATTADPCTGYARSLMRRGRRRESTMAAARAESLTTHGAEARALAGFWAQAGAPGNAMRLVRRALELSPSPEMITALERDSTLAAIRGSAEFKSALRSASRPAASGSSGEHAPGRR